MILSADLIKQYIARQQAGEPFLKVSADWRATGLSVQTLKDLLRGTYASVTAQAVYAELGYAPRAIKFAPRNFRAKLLAPHLLDIRRRVRAGASLAEVAADFRIERETADAIVKGKYATLAMREALTMEPTAQQ